MPRHAAVAAAAVTSPAVAAVTSRAAAAPNPMAEAVGATAPGANPFAARRFNGLRLIDDGFEFVA